MSPPLAKLIFVYVYGCILYELVLPSTNNVITSFITDCPLGALNSIDVFALNPELYPL